MRFPQCQETGRVPTLWHWHADTSTCNPVLLAAISKQMNELLECDGAPRSGIRIALPVVVRTQSR